MTLPFDLPVATEEETTAAASTPVAVALPLYAYDQPVPTLADELTVTAIGKPITQGSKTKTRWGMYDDNAKTLHPWRDSVTAAALAARGNRAPITGAVEVHCWFYFDRPDSHYGTGRNAGTLKPSAPAYPLTQAQGDVDKLIRTILDSLATAKVFANDKLVARVYGQKLWNTSPSDLERAVITIRELT